MAAWDRLPNEPMRWFARFEAYRIAGPNRTIEAVYQAGVSDGKQKRPSIHWYDKAKQYEWVSRAQAWDKYEIERARVDYENEREAERKIRRDLLLAYRAKIVEAMKLLNPTDARWGDVTQAIKTINEQLRLEYGEETGRLGLEHSGAGGGELVIKVTYEQDNPDNPETP